MNRFVISLGIMLCISGLMACQSKKEQNRITTEAKPDSVLVKKQLDSLAKVALGKMEDAKMDSVMAIIKNKPIWGERKTVTGDFNGDGKLDTLCEKYISRVTGLETNKDYDFSGLDEDADWIGYQQMWISEKDPLVRLESKNPGIKSFNVEWGGAQNGFDYLKNVGDLNGDSTDEIVYYIYDVDFSVMNSAALATYKNGKWKEVHHWEITESDFEYEAGGPMPNPTYIKKKNGKVYCKEMDFGAGSYVWKRLKTNW